MASPRPPTSPPSSNTIIFPANRQETAVKPNPHPYAIRTTSTGILTRSNSSGHNSAASHHRYVPLSPTPHSRRHRYSKSLTEEPQPLPIPPTLTGNGRYESRSGAVLSQEDLPSNPKLWNSSHLSTYLRTALRVVSDGHWSSCESDQLLPVSAVEIVIDFVNEARMTGRIFLRLSEEDLKQ